MLRTFVLAFFLLPAAAAAAQPMLSLDEAIRQALDGNYAVRMARNDARIASNDHGLGNAGFLPSLRVNAQQSRRALGGFSGGGSGQPVFGNVQSFDASMTVDATLFEGMGRFAAYERLGSQEEAAALGAARTTEAVLAGVVRAYYELVRQQEQIEVLREAVTLSEERLRIASLRRDLGSASELEVRRAQVDLNADRAALLRQQVALSGAKATFDQLLARQGGGDYQVADTIRVDRTLTPERLGAVALERNKAVRWSRQARVTAALARREARSDWLPTVGLQLGYNFSDLTQELGLPVSRPGGLSYGLTASWGLFEGFNRERRMENATLRLRNADLAVEEARTRVVTLLDNAFVAYRSALTLVDLERDNITLARFNVEVALEQFRLGTIRSVELREVQSALTAAEGRFINAQYEAKQAETELLHLSGTLTDRLLADR